MEFKQEEYSIKGHKVSKFIYDKLDPAKNPGLASLSKEELRAKLSELNYFNSIIFNRKLIYESYLEYQIEREKKIFESTVKEEEEKLKIEKGKQEEWKETPDDIYFPSLSEVAENIKRGDTLILPRKRKISDILDESIKNKKFSLTPNNDGTYVVSIEVPPNTKIVN